MISTQSEYIIADTVGKFKKVECLFGLFFFTSLCFLKNKSVNNLMKQFVKI